ncbi:MAG TPA: hypothetical protein VGL09_20335 [Methylomirabilota bacterium]
MKTALTAPLVLLALLASGPRAASAQVFLASQPHPEFAIGPLFIVATVTPALSPVTVRVSWGLTMTPGHGPAEARQDLYLLWPAEVVTSTAPGAPDPTLRASLEQRGFTVVSEGRLLVSARDRDKLGTAAPSEPTKTVAPFVTFYKTGTTPQAGVGTFVKIPWTPLLTDPVALVSLTLELRDLVTPKPATWFEEVFWGRRQVLTLGAGTPGSVALYSMYLQQRDHVVRLAHDFSLIITNFSDADHLRIEEINPPGATRRPSRVRAGSETITLPLGAGEGGVPQALRVQFAYFSGRIAWRPILISLLFLALGNVMGTVMFAQQVGRLLHRRLHVGRAHGHGRTQGTLVPRATVDRIMPGVATYRDVVALCGAPDEEAEVPSRARRRLLYRGSRRVAHRKLSFGWVGTVSRWDEEQHEVEILLDGDRVTAVEARLRRSRMS